MSLYSTCEKCSNSYHLIEGCKYCKGEKMSGHEGKTVDDVRHRVKRLHELGPNHEHFKIGDMDCEFMLKAYDGLQRKLDENDDWWKRLFDKVADERDAALEREAGLREALKAIVDAPENSRDAFEAFKKSIRIARQALQIKTKETT